MRNAYVVTVLSLALVAPRVVSAQVEVRATINIGRIEVAATAFVNRVLFEVDVQLDALRDWIDDENDRWYSGNVHRRRRPQQSRDWSRAAARWQDALLGNDAAPEDWNSYGDALYNDGRHRESIAAYQRAIQLGVEHPDVAALNVARAYAHLGNRKQALRWVERSHDLGGASPDGVRDDETFEKHRDDPAFSIIATSCLPQRLHPSSPTLPC